MKGKLFLIPNTLGGENTDIIPSHTVETAKNIKFFIVENERNARRYLSSIGLKGKIRDLELFAIEKHAKRQNFERMLAPALAGADMGLISEAGCPSIADPGEEVVSTAHKKRIKVVPLVGPSSIMLALMASGLNAEQFAFSAYLPIDQRQRENALQRLESWASKSGQTQIFMETPFRNNQMLDSIIRSCNPKTRLCIACNITMKDEQIQTKSVQAWREKKPDLHKKPCIFLIGKN